MTRIGVIGAGNWGKNLVRTFKDLGKLGGVAEINAQIRKRLAEQYPDVPLYSDYNSLLQTGVSAIVIATPAVTHYQLAREALILGKDVFVEKPLTLSWPEAAELVKLAEQKERILLVGHLLLYQPALGRIKKIIDSGVMGQVVFFSQERLKLGRVRQTENVLWSFGVHDIAALLYLAGQKPQRVGAMGQCFLQEKIADDVYVHLQFPSGIKAHLHVGWLWPAERRCLTVVGSAAMLIYDELQQKVVLYRKKIGTDGRGQDAGSEVVYQEKERAEPLLRECRHFLDCIAERKQPLSDGRSALEVIEVLERAEDSYAHPLS